MEMVSRPDEKRAHTNLECFRHRHSGTEVAFLDSSWLLRTEVVFLDSSWLLRIEVVFLDDN